MLIHPSIPLSLLFTLLIGILIGDYVRCMLAGIYRESSDVIFGTTLTVFLCGVLSYLVLWALRVF